MARSISPVVVLVPTADGGNYPRHALLTAVLSDEDSGHSMEETRDKTATRLATEGRRRRLATIA